MSVIREDNVCRITFEDDAWKEAAPEIYSVVDGAKPFYSADTWLLNEKQTLRSGTISSGGTSETTITVVLQEDGKVNLSCTVSSRSSYGRLRVLIDGTEKINISGTVNFTEYEYALSAGSHEIIFRYTKSSSTVSGKDAGAIGYIQFTGVEPPYEKRYLMTDFEGKVYTVADRAVQEVPTLQKADLTTKSIFQEYGFADAPTSEQLLSLTRPVLYRWCDGDVKNLHAEVTATPKVQTIRAVADMTHESILGILSMTSVYSGNVTASYSYDDATYTDPVPMDEFLQTDPAALYDVAESKMIYFKFVLSDTAASLTNFVITYKND